MAVSTPTRASKRTFHIAGFPFPACPLFTRARVESSLTYRPQSKDVVLSSYPKCDSKQVEVMLWKLLYPDEPLPPVDNITNRRLPCIEVVGLEQSLQDHFRPPRLLKTYLPFHMIPFCKRARYIYVTRAPWSACDSYYELLSLVQDEDDGFDSFFQDFLWGRIGYGSFFDHILPWTNRVNDDNVLLLCHEHVSHNPRSALFLIAAFLGGPHLEGLLHDDALVDQILAAADWDGTTAGRSPRCSGQQTQQLVERIAEKFKDTSIEHVWLNHLKSYVMATWSCYFPV